MRPDITLLVAAIAIAAAPRPATAPAPAPGPVAMAAQREAKTRQLPLTADGHVEIHVAGGRATSLLLPAPAKSAAALPTLGTPQLADRIAALLPPADLPAGVRLPVVFTLVDGSQIIVEASTVAGEYDASVEVTRPTAARPPPDPTPALREALDHCEAEREAAASGAGLREALAQALLDFGAEQAPPLGRRELHANAKHHFVRVELAAAYSLFHDTAIVGRATNRDTTDWNPSGVLVKGQGGTQVIGTVLRLAPRPVPPGGTAVFVIQFPTPAAGKYVITVTDSGGRDVPVEVEL